MENFIKNYIINTKLGYITYAEFIEKVLYHPELGYYMKDRMKIGREGDFITTSNFANIYGKILAKWYSKLVLKLGIPANVFEIGAGTGRFAKSFIDEWAKIMSVPLSYTILETSPYHRLLQQENINFNENIKQVISLQDIKAFSGLVFSNELFDALPVHVIQKQNNQLVEIMVTLQNDRLVEKQVPLDNEGILKFLSSHNIQLNEAQRIEIPLAMINLIHSISEVVSEGLILTVDYGYSRQEWKEPAHKNGSLRGYYKHQMIHDVLLHPGEMDITSHIHFDALIEAGENVGFSFIQKLRQDEFFLSIGILDELQDDYDPNPFSEKSKQNRAIRSLIMPSGISPAFHTILQHKNLHHIADKII
jgi:SAM-dependent MidA family methyltransferase